MFNAVGAPQAATPRRQASRLTSALLPSAAPDTGNQYSWSLRADAFLRGGADQINVRSGNEVGTVVNSRAARLWTAGTNLPNYGAMNAFDARTVTIGYTHLFTPAIVNQFRFQYQRGTQAFPPSTSLPAALRAGDRHLGLRPDGRLRHFPAAARAKCIPVQRFPFLGHRPARAEVWRGRVSVSGKQRE